MWIRPLFHSLCALGALSLSTQAFSADNFSCKAELKWVNSPNAPIEIPEGKEADFCQFYQFSWQWFLQLVSPAKDSTIRQFQDQKIIQSLKVWATTLAMTRLVAIHYSLC